MLQVAAVAHDDETETELPDSPDADSADAAETVEEADTSEE